MVNRIVTYMAFGALLLFGGCSISSDSGGGGNGGNGPTNNPMSVQVDGLDEQLVTGQQREYGISVQDDDNFSDFDVEATHNGQTLWHKTNVPAGTSWDTTAHITPEQEGTLTIDYYITDDFSGTKETEAGDKSAQVVGPISFNGQLNLNVDEGDTARVSDQQLSDLVSYKGGTQPGSITLGTNDPDININDVSDGYELIPGQGVTGPQDYFITVRTQGGQEETQNETLTVNNLPNMTLVIQNNETDQTLQDMIVPDQLTAHIGVYDQNGTRVDTLSNNTGVFDVDLPGEEYAIIKASLRRDGQPFSWVRTDTLEHNGADIDKLVKAVDWYVRDINENVVDELTPGAEGIKDPEKFRGWVYGTRDGGVATWNGDTNTRSPESGIFHWYTDSDNGRVPDEVWLANKFYSINANEESVMYADPRNASIEIYENHMRPWSDGELPALVQKDSLSFDYENNAYKDIALIKPISNPKSGQLGNVVVYGEAEKSIYNSISGIRSDGEGWATYDQLLKAASQEQMNGIGLFSAASADDFGATNAQSSTHDAFSGTYPTNLDGKHMRALFERNYTSTLDAVFGEPKQ